MDSVHPVHPYRLPSSGPERFHDQSEVKQLLPTKALLPCLTFAFICSLGPGGASRELPRGHRAMEPNHHGGGGGGGRDKTNKMHNVFQLINCVGKFCLLEE